MKKATSIFLLLFWTAAWSSPKPGNFVTSGPTGDKKIALSFDDGPGVETEEFLRLLDKYQVKGTFFMLAEQVKNRPKIARLVVEKGHEIGSHTFNHVNYLKRYRAHLEKVGAEDKAVALAKKELMDDMAQSRRIIEEATGVTLKICRMPHGIDRPWIKEAAGETGFVLVNWTHGSDWLKEDEEKTRKAYRDAIKPGAILLFHDGGKNRQKSIALTEEVLKSAREQGYFIITVGELIGLAP